MALRKIDLSPTMPSEASFAIKNIDSPNFLINFISSNLNIDVKEKQKILEKSSLAERSSAVMEHLNREIKML